MGHWSSLPQVSHVVPNPTSLIFVFSLVSRLPVPGSIIYIFFQKSQSFQWRFSSFFLPSVFLTPLAVITVECVPDDVLVRFVGRANNYDRHDFWKREVKISSLIEPHSGAERDEFRRNTLPWENKLLQLCKFVWTVNDLGKVWILFWVSTFDFMRTESEWLSGSMAVALFSLVYWNHCIFT